MDLKSGDNALATENFQRPTWAPENEYKASLDYANTLLLSVERTAHLIDEWKREAVKVDELVGKCKAQFLEVVRIPKEPLGEWNCGIRLPTYYCETPVSYVEKVEKELDKWESTWEMFIKTVPRGWN